MERPRSELLILRAAFLGVGKSSSRRRNRMDAMRGGEATVLAVPGRRFFFVIQLGGELELHGTRKNANANDATTRREIPNDGTNLYTLQLFCCVVVSPTIYNNKTGWGATTLLC